MRIKIFASAILFLAAACAPDAERAAEPGPSGPNIEVVKALMDAFNDHDPDEMRKYWHHDVTWVEITGDRSSVVTTSAEQLHAELVAYFEAYPSVSSTLEQISANGEYVSGVEHPVWEQDGERKTQRSNVVYQIVDGKVKRFWYFPPQT
ncbi:MAG: nuclear transport factor 2 family protein [Marinicaulis sp.]|nr:nuclear transport factor 2 family protein [Marinicaulis sp.]NNE42050.1 nuclear transport factor 2 family protein [Marinicaulis sp.]NNL87846.1 nuclear transport factor 2 family protein [Marinicaulis sp.]